MTAPARAASDARQAWIGLGLAAAIFSAWLCLHVYGVFFHRWTVADVALAPLLVAFQCWLSVGLFIVAHDAMHGSLAPFRPRLNRAVGRVALGLYVGFSYDRLIPKHFAHHRHAGTGEDPDFHLGGPRRFWPWYLAFFTRYFGLREFLIVGAAIATYVLMLRADPLNLAVFWGLPAILSSLQLFYFGTYLPHRHEDAPFTDRHNARSTDFGPLASLLTCFHFGYHHEHHEQPNVPWWRLPRTRHAVSEQPIRQVA